MSSGSTTTVGVFVVEDDASTREMLVRKINRSGRHRVVGTEGRLDRARAQIPLCLPDVLLVDLELPDGSGVDLIAEQFAVNPNVPALVISIFGDEDRVVDAISAGAQGYLLKDDDGEEIVDAIDEVLRGESPISPRIATHLIRRFQVSAPSPPSTHPLSRRELEVLQLAAKGLSYKETADMIGVQCQYGWHVHQENLRKTRRHFSRRGDLRGHPAWFDARRRRVTTADGETRAGGVTVDLDRSRVRPTRGAWLSLVLACVVAPPLVLSLMLLVDRPIWPAPEYRVPELEYVVDARETPPSERHDWQPLTQVVADIPSQPYASVWVRADIGDLLKPEQINALLIMWPHANLQVWLQGSLRHSTGPNELPLPFISSPLLIPLGDYEPDPGPIWGYSHITREAGVIGPAAVYVGPWKALLPAFERRQLIHTTLPQVAVVIMLVLIALTFGLYLMRPSETAYAWYAMTMLLWAAHTAHPLVDYPPLSLTVWGALNYLTLAWVASGVMFVNRFFGFRQPRLEMVMGVITILVAALILTLALRQESALLAFVLHKAWVPWTILISLLISALCVAAVFKRWSIASRGLLVMSSITFVVGLRDYLFELYAFGPGSIYYLQFVALIPMTFFTFLLLQRHVRALRESEDLNAHLECRVAEKATALEDSYRRLGEEERRRQLAEERARLQRDMHDGLGGQLVHALSLSEHPQDREDLQAALRDALNDLRLIVDSLAPADRGLSDLVANFRHRASKAIRRTGTEIQWDLTDLGSITVSSEQSLALLRIVQEATTNAGATRRVFAHPHRVRALEQRAGGSRLRRWEGILQADSRAGPEQHGDSGKGHRRVAEGRIECARNCR